MLLEFGAFKKAEKELASEQACSKINSFFSILTIMFMQITKATAQNRNDITELLQSQQLPTADLPSTFSDFYTMIDNGIVIGLIGMERYGDYGLLRSLVVHPDYRNLQIAATLIKMLEEQVTSSGITAMYLLTETADKYFSRKGYNTITRDEVPDEVKQSSEFSHVCPVSAIVMRKDLSNQSYLTDASNLERTSYQDRL